MKLYIGTEKIYSEIKFTHIYPENEVNLFDDEDFKNYLDGIFIKDNIILTNSSDILKYAIVFHMDNCTIYAPEFIEEKLTDYASIFNKTENIIEYNEDNIKILSGRMGEFYSDVTYIGYLLDK